MHLEGIISKQRDSPYRSGRQPTWIKSKCTRSDTFPIVAFVEKLGARPRRIASLYVGRREGNRLLYAGKVNTGYTELIQRDLRERLDRYIRRTTPLSVPVKKPKATWVEPKLQAEVQYGSLTSAHLLRQAVYKGLRDDLTDEPPVPTASIKGATPRSPRPIRVPKENILQLLPDAVSPSREELATYWKKVAKRALPFLGNRPLKLVRTVHGTTFYHRGPLPPIPPSVHELKIRKREGGEGTRLWIDDLAGFLGLIEIGAVELHPWNATVDDIEHVDQIVFDLDPGEGIDWPFVKETALTLREQLQTEGVSSWPKLTGGKGLHIMVPVVAHSMTHDEAHNYSKHIAQALARTNPTRYTTIANFAARRGRLFIDYLRNGRGTTAVGTYSPRARPGFPIAAPVTWKSIESTQTLRPDTFSMGHLPPAPAKPHKPTA
jgi:bifunctional non-homologous end joining protein LigD